MQRRAVALRGIAHIGDREPVRRRLDFRLQIGIAHILDDAHPDDVDDLALIAGNALIEEGKLGAFHRIEPRDILTLHLLDGDHLRRPVAQAGIGISHRTPFLPEKPASLAPARPPIKPGPAGRAQTVPRRELSRPSDVCLLSEFSA